jgi:hypothetical protein
MQSVSKELYNGIPNVTVRRVLQKRLNLKDSLYAFKYKHFRNIRHTATFGLQFEALFETPHITIVLKLRAYRRLGF